MTGRRCLVVGFGVTGQAVARRLVELDRPVVAVDDHPRPDLRRTAESWGVELAEAPTEAGLRTLVEASDVVYPGPGLPDRHPVFALAAAADVPIESEFDLAAELDERPLVAVTGTDGKTTVTTLVTDMLCRSGIPAVSAGNNELPLIEAVTDPAPSVFVVEASSFRLAHTRRFLPEVATWLNFGPDHQDAHSSMQAYEAAKARIWADLPVGAAAVANADDAVVMRNVRDELTTTTFGGSGDYRSEAGILSARGETICAVGELPRRFDHDLSNGLAASATAMAAGAGIGAAGDALRGFTGLPHRVAEVGSVGAVRFFDDSKATTPHAAAAAVSGFASVVLIAGGRGKGLPFDELVAQAPRIRRVVAIGDAAPDVAAAFDGLTEVQLATDMASAVQLGLAASRADDVVLLSPACASYDWYSSYVERGDDFVSRVRDLPGFQPAGAG